MGVLRKILIWLLGIVVTFLLISIITTTTLDLELTPKITNLGLAIYDNADSEAQNSFKSIIDTKLCDEQTKSLQPYCEADKRADAFEACSAESLPFCNILQTDTIEQLCTQVSAVNCAQVESGELEYREVFVSLFLANMPKNDAAMVEKIGADQLVSAYKIEQLIFNKSTFLIRIGLFILFVFGLWLAYEHGRDFLSHIGGIFTRIGFLFAVINGAMFIYLKISLPIDTSIILSDIGSLVTNGLTQIIPIVLPLLAEQLVSAAALIVSIFLLITGISLQLFFHKPHKSSNIAQTPPAQKPPPTQGMQQQTYQFKEQPPIYQQPPQQPSA